MASGNKGNGERWALANEPKRASDYQREALRAVCSLAQLHIDVCAMGLAIEAEEGATRAIRADLERVLDEWHDPIERKALETAFFDYVRRYGKAPEEAR